MRSPTSTPARAIAQLVQAVATALLLTGCAGSGGSSESRADWSKGIPDPGSAVVSLESLSHDPPRVIGLVGDDHPSASADDAELRRGGIKRIPAARMTVLVAELEKRGFLASSQPLIEFKPADASYVLRRLVVSAGGERRAFTLPRGPAKDAADCFNIQAHAVQAMFNEVVDFRLEGSAKSATHFYQLQQRLFDADRRRRGAGKSP